MSTDVVGDLKMLTLGSETEIADFERREGLVAIYLDHGYNREVIELMSSIRRSFDDHVGAAWHLLMPAERGYVPDGYGVGPYNTKLALDLARRYDIPINKLPALLFEFIPGEERYWVSLAGMTAGRVRNLLLNIAEYSVQEFRGGERELHDFRASVHRQIVPYLNREKLLHFSGHAATALTTFVATLAGAKSLGM